ncbi:MAG: phosphatidate cytidylyltransferase, partial [Tepidiformaceae bacterium]
MGIKDSSQLLPGHGGFLDRLDSILFVMPVLYVFLQIAT